MKKFKKLIPAFCAMLVSAAMLGTSTYAWFSMNKKVTANNLTVTAQANTQYFVISDSADFSGKAVEKTLAAANITQRGTVVAEDTDTAKTTVYPAAYGQVTATEDEQKGLENAWWTANVSLWNSTSNDNIANVQPITAPATKTQVYENDKYFVGYSFYVGLADGSDAFDGALKIKATDATNAAKVAAVKVEQYKNDAVYSGTTAEYIRIEGVAGSTVTTQGIKAAAGETYSYKLQAGTNDEKLYVKVTVYVFIDGNNNEIKDEFTLANLTGTVGVIVAAATETI